MPKSSCIIHWPITAPMNTRRLPEVRSIRNACTLIEVIIVMAIIGILVCLLFPAINYVRSLSLRASCVNNLRQVGLALSNYKQRLGESPPPMVRSSPPLPSDTNTTWLSLLLGDIDERHLFETYNYKKRFDAVENQTAAEQWVATYVCPAADSNVIDGFAPSNVVMAPGAMVAVSYIGPDKLIFAGEIIRQNLGWARPYRSEDFELFPLPYSVARVGIGWEECAQRGFNVKSNCPDKCEDFLQFSSAHVSGANFLFSDGHVAYLVNEIDFSTFRKMLNPAAAE